MTLNIRTNLPSIAAQRNLAASTGRIQTAYERLSSGLRINRAKDDAAGMAISEQLLVDAKVASVAIRNANDGVSVIAIADAAVGQLTTVLTRMAELAEQSANGVFSNRQRSALQLEFQELQSEIERIALTTEFNGVRLLSGNSSMTFQVGFDGGSLSQVSYSGIAGTLDSLGLAAAGTSTHLFSIQATTADQSQSAARTALDAINGAIGSLTFQRGFLGATESRLEAAINNLRVARENYTAAASRIRDVDVAEEAAELARLSILQQAGTAILAQANQQPQLALQLLG